MTDFFSQGVLGGVETEYGLNATGQDRLLKGAVMGEATGLPFAAMSWLANGARWYTDHGHPEYATPEDTVDGTVRNIIVGEQIAWRAMANIFGPEKIQHLGQRVNGPGQGREEFFGTHGNLLIPAGLDPVSNRVTEGVLALHYATRAVFVGGGKYDVENDRWVLWQKWNAIKQFASRETTRNRPLVNLRSEPLADGRRYFRLHDTSGDANVSPWAMRHKMGGLAMIMMMRHYGVRLDDLRLDRHTWKAAVETAGTDTTLRKTITLADGRKMRPMEVEAEFTERAKRMAVERELPPEMVEIIQQREEADTPDPDDLVHRADWAARMSYANRYLARNPDQDNPTGRLARDLAYSNVGPRRGAGFQMRDKGWFAWNPSQERPLDEAPLTRASLRGRFVIATHRLGLHETVRVDWAHLRGDHRFNGGRTALLPDPHSSQNEKVEEALRAYEQLAA